MRVIETGYYRIFTPKATNFHPKPNASNPIFVSHFFAGKQHFYNSLGGPVYPKYRNRGFVCLFWGDKKKRNNTLTIDYFWRFVWLFPGDNDAYQINHVLDMNDTRRKLCWGLFLVLLGWDWYRGMWVRSLSRYRCVIFIKIQKKDNIE